MYRIESHIVEKLKEQGLSIEDLFQERNSSSSQCKPFKYIYQGNETDIEKVIVMLAGVGINLKKENIEIVDKTWDYEKHINDEIDYILINGEDK